MRPVMISYQIAVYLNYIVIKFRILDHEPPSVGTVISVQAPIDIIRRKQFEEFG